MKILVTGGAGFIGSAVVRHIIENTQDEVRVVDCLTYAGNLESLASVADNTRYSFSRTDITDAQGVAQQFSEFRPDIVMHLAAESHLIARSPARQPLLRLTLLVPMYCWKQAANTGQR